MSQRKAELELLKLEVATDLLNKKETLRKHLEPNFFPISPDSGFNIAELIRDINSLEGLYKHVNRALEAEQ